METVLRDIRVTLRAFRRSLGFPLTAIATLALGIGATTAIFTALSAVLLKPLPYPNPEDLYSLRTTLASDVVGGTLRRQELAMMLIFGAIAIVLAAVGIYGVVSYAGSLRREEMATRLALGASPRSVFMLVMKQGVTLGLVGAGIGLVLAYFSGQVISNRVYAIRAPESGERVAVEVGLEPNPANGYVPIS